MNAGPSFRGKKGKIMSDRKRKKKDGNGLAAAIMIACCAGIGFLAGTLGVPDIPEDTGLPAFLAGYLLQILLLLAAFWLQLILHEGGHLLAGLMTGYRFSSFRIGSLMLLKTGGGYSFRKFSLAGTGGQCLLIPPDRAPDGTYPYRFYHLGGVLLNLITGALFFAVYRLCPAGSAAGAFCLYLAVTGALCAATNGIPVRVSGVATDGCNVISIGKDPFALEAMWLQLKINEAQTEGVRLKDLPEGWFRIPDGAAKGNVIVSAMAVCSENRAMDGRDFGRAKEIVAALEEDEEYLLIGLYKSLLLMDRITIDLIENGEKADVSALDSRQNKAFRRAMAKYPAVIRTEYAVRLLKEKDPAAAKKCRETFEAVARRYPMKADIDSEREIMDHLDLCAGADG